VSDHPKAMKEAHDHQRVSPEGRHIGELTAKVADRCAAKLEAEGEPDERCKTCAFRAGTVPNGCLQTQADAIKAVIEDVPFLCHQNLNTICHGWFAIGVQMNGRVGSVPWEFSPPDQPEPAFEGTQS
jgi:hypothetical protein